MKTKILLVGSAVLKEHINNGCFDDFNIVKTYFGMSPFSLGEAPRVQKISKTRLTLPLRFDVNNDFIGFLKKNPADYIIVDLQKLLADLLEVDGSYCTNQPENEDKFYKENQDKTVKVTDFPFDRFHTVFDSFANTVKAHFKPDKIILVSAFVPSFYVEGRQVRPHKNSFKYNNWYTHFEKRFADLTGCVLLQKSKIF